MPIRTIRGSAPELHHDHKELTRLGLSYISGGSGGIPIDVENKDCCWVIQKVAQELRIFWPCLLTF